MTGGMPYARSLCKQNNATTAKLFTILAAELQICSDILFETGDAIFGSSIASWCFSSEPLKSAPSSFFPFH